MDHRLLGNNHSYYKRKSIYDNGYGNCDIPKGKLLHLIIRIGITIITILVISLFIKSNNKIARNLSIMQISIEEHEFFNSLGFPLNSKELIYSKLESWGFNLSDIGEEGLNPEYNEGNIKNYKYSKYTYKDILLLNYVNNERSEISKNIFLYKFIELLKTKEINTFYDFLQNFMILQDLNCLPISYKGIYINNKFFTLSYANEFTIDDINKVETLINEKPFLYLTYHGGKKKNGIHNICKFSRDGYFLGSVLLPFEHNGIFFNIVSLRGLLLHDNYLYVADSFKNNSKIYKFSDTINNLSNRREFVSVFISQDNQSNPLMIHPYGIKKHDDYFYISSQNTGTVLRFDIEDGELGPSKDSLKNTHNGVVVKLNQFEEIRGLDFDHLGRCYVSNKQVGVQVYDKNFNLIKIIPMFSPISVLFNNANNRILVGSSKSHDIKEYDTQNFELIKTIKHPLLKHVAGMVIYKDSLFVISQRKNKLLEFSLTTNLLKNIIINDFSDIGERVILSWA
ncbi:conserved Plasmodium protein, unknown function [Plasmodium vinckei vinckei]|uniref:Uncharacterized protein n=1 Tax=Plasmodium vinckei vinckei TaxID=54757 RepID=A0A449C0A8_PLAVN|nr:conserved Plasmodium protein, unknown function [Plasmodium vinckei vinckei]KEG04054.1 hypothetical protein YYE_00956 [Plasmodium vinckei vinckei]VEV59148.1 conserved Plasmodium protein, unknown function [Plasmodium vinckei vinckei]